MAGSLIASTSSKSMDLDMLKKGKKIQKLAVASLVCVGTMTMLYDPANSQSVRQVTGNCQAGTSAGLFEGWCSLRTWLDAYWIVVEVSQEMTLTRPNTHLGERAGRPFSEVTTIRLTNHDDCQAWAGRAWRHVADAGCFAETLESGRWVDSPYVVRVTYNQSNGRPQFAFSAGSGMNFSFDGDLPRPNR
jgi:hypothetical protein